MVAHLVVTEQRQSGREGGERDGWVCGWGERGESSTRGGEKWKIMHLPSRHSFFMLAVLMVHAFMFHTLVLHTLIFHTSCSYFVL